MAWQLTVQFAEGTRGYIGRGSMAAILFAGERCPSCEDEPLEVRAVRATNERIGARCLKCNDALGYLTQRTDDVARRMAGETIFGAEEDAAMLEHGRARVYR